MTANPPEGDGPQAIPPETVRAAALYYLERGWTPIPLKARTKIPVSKAWTALRPTAADLANLFPRGARLNVGAHCGTPSGGRVDADLDAPEALTAAPYLLPPTRLIHGRAGKPRSHWWYVAAQPPDRTHQFEDVDGTMLLEVRSTGGQTMLPPSIHPDGDLLTWEEYGEPARVEGAALLRAAAATAAAALFARHWPEEGSRQNAALALAGGLLRAGWPVERCEILLRAILAAAGDGDLGERLSVLKSTAEKVQQGQKAVGWPRLAELLPGRGRDIVDRACQWLGLGRAARTATSGGAPPEPPIPLGEVPEADPFPVPTLPVPLTRFVGEVAAAVNCPPDFAAVPLLALAGGAIGNSRRLLITGSHTQGACLFAVAVGRPGSGKTPAEEIAAEPLERAEQDWLRAWKAELEAWKEKDLSQRGQRPALRRSLVDDTTTEKLASILEENPRGVAMARDELAALVCGLNQYKAGKGHDRQVYEKLWSQASIRVDRKNNPDGAPIVVYRPFVGIVGGIQPDVVAKLREEGPAGARALDDGFLDRFLFAYPSELPARKERWLAVSEEASEAWAAAVQYLLALDMEQGERGPRPRLVFLTACGKAAWERFTEAHAAELNDPDFPPHLWGPWSKLKAYCGRLALIVHCLRLACGEVRRPGLTVGERTADENVDGESMTRAALLVAYFKSHARKVYAAMDADPRVKDARRILGSLARNAEQLLDRHPEGFTRRDLYQYLRRHFKTPEGLDAPLRLLVEHRYLYPAEPEAAGQPRRKAERYQVNPLWERTQNSQNTQNPPPEADSVDFVNSVYGFEESE